MESKLYTLAEIAKRIGVTEKKMIGWTMILDNFPEPYQIGDERFYDMQEILIWLLEQKRQKQAEGKL